MTESSPEDLPQVDEEEALKKRLLNRIAIAGVVVVALLGGLAVFDAVYVPVSSKPKAPPVVAKAPEPPPEVVKVEEAKIEAPVTEPTPATTPADAPKDAGAMPSKTEVAQAPVVSNAAKAPQPPSPPEPPSVPEETGSTRMRPLKPLTPPATARQAMIRPSEPMAASKPGPLSGPLNRAVQAAREFVLQLGVFNNVANAEELRAKLELNGIPAQIEARVQVGPFKTRAEADAARQKLQALGMDSGILTAVANRK